MMADNSLDVARRCLRFLQQTAGRDKVYRAAQYGSRLILWFWTGKSDTPRFIGILKTLEAHLVISRKRKSYINTHVFT